MHFVAIHRPQTSIRLKTTRDTYTSNTIKILKVFRSNLAKLYSPTQEFDAAKADTLFSSIAFPTLEQEQRNLLERRITDREVKDEFSAAYYKQFAPILMPILTKAFNSILTKA